MAKDIILEEPPKEKIKQRNPLVKNVFTSDVPIIDTEKYQFLSVRERIAEGDEFFYGDAKDGKWLPASSYMIGIQAGHHFWYRRPKATVIKRYKDNSYDLSNGKRIDKLGCTRY